MARPRRTWISLAAGCAAAGPWLEDLPFYEQTVHKTIAYLHDQGLARARAPFPGEVPPHLFAAWCPPGAAGPPRRDLPAGSPEEKISPGDVGIVVMTALRFEGTRVQYINRTWGKRFPELVFVSGEAPGVADARIHRVAAPPGFLRHFEADSYMSHVYKGHTGLGHLFGRRPELPWYGLVSDDSYVFGPFLAEALRAATRRPAREAVCVGHLQRQPKDVHWGVIRRMFRLCERFAGFGADWVDLCKEKAGLLRLPFVNVTYAHGAGIFCSNAAMALLQPHLLGVLSSGVFEQFGPQFAEFIQPADELMGRCAAELGIRMVDMHGYFAGSHVPGAVRNDEPQLPEFREGLPRFSLASAARPALWHEVRDPMQFEALEYLYSVVGGLLRAR